MTDSPVEVKPSPLLGQHNEEVYGDLLGLTSDSLNELKKEGVI
jgi:formyl-CoA transferase